MTERVSEADEAREKAKQAIARILLSRRGFPFCDDPMESGQDAYDITLEALDEAEAILASGVVTVVDTAPSRKP